MHSNPDSDSDANRPVDIVVPAAEEYRINISGSIIHWHPNKGLLSVDGSTSSLFKIESSLTQIMAPIAKEIGTDLFRLLIAQAASGGGAATPRATTTTLDGFVEHFTHWSDNATKSGWGKFEILTFDPANTQAIIQVDNPWELEAQRHFDENERWGCPFILGKIIDLFKHTQGINCWGTDKYTYLNNGESQVIIEIHPSDRTLDLELSKLRQQRLTQQEIMLSQEIEEKTVELQKSYTILENISNLDFLTNLNNRRAFEERLSAIKNAGQWNNYTILYVDLDQFKVINDTCGHAAGDSLLTTISERLISSIDRSKDFIARYGADEFILLINDNTDHSLTVADNIRHAIQNAQFQWKGKAYQISCSIGLVPLDTIEPEVKNAVIAADNACNEAKRNGRNQVYMAKTLDDFVENRLTEMNWIHTINSALRQDKFRLHFQIIKPLCDSPRFGLEALIRMEDSDHSLIMPFKFLPTAERYNAIFKIDCWVIDKVFSIMNHDYGKLNYVDFISINLSGDTLSNPHLKSFIENRFERYPINPEKICFEVTETHMIMNLERAKSLLENLRNNGCKIALDDFGAGMSSFGYLRDLPIDKIKIDGSFVRSMHENMVDYTFVESIANVAKSMNIQTVAEFVENQKIVELLSDISVDYGQGFHLGKPCPWDQIIF
ncbi:MAG: EAL domain-containing protein [Cellvibrionaceae bacterium]|nr:EAL domain-containing protein [Cellvibrionaceae bacterium]